MVLSLLLHGIDEAQEYGRAASDPHRLEFSHSGIAHRLDCFLLLGSERYPLCGRNEKIMDYYIAAVRKVYAALNEAPAEEERNITR